MAECKSYKHSAAAWEEIKAKLQAAREGSERQLAAGGISARATALKLAIKQ